jgi:hypothetical protein
MSRILALQEDKEGSQDVDDVHCNNHEPQHHNHPSLDHDPKQRDSKGRLAEGACHDCQTFANIAQEGHLDEVIWGFLDNFEVLS